MVLFRAAMLGVMGLFPLAWCLSLGGGRADTSSLLSLPHPQELSQDDLQPFLSRQGNTDSAGAPSSVADYTGYDKSEVLRGLEDPTSSSAYRLQEALSEAVAAAAAAAEGAEGVRDGAAALSPTANEGVTLEDLVPYDPGYYLYPAFLNRGDEAMTGGSSGINSLRKVRNSNRSNRSNSSSGISGSNTSSNSNTNNNSPDTISMAKRTWPNGFSRRRASGLSLSIDASMKVLREALYMEIIRKKQRQQMQRAQHNQKLLNSIGKRDVTRQLQQEGIQGVYQRGQRK
ncbi:uncharacterized protein LOC121861710 [Homarus americanus]|uniref:uncharacterized protein LOC121861710 n=1 Tax=Homarus americanus TaxID=6706 RepID=UPI001C4646E1|nr:uncharacterized protein LOC121861710 [Homarus americanus]XP_042215557.1 uncharacterized protein LOC121861710 [Homarus americanus]